MESVDFRKLYDPQNVSDTIDANFTLFDELLSDVDIPDKTTLSLARIMFCQSLDLCYLRQLTQANFDDLTRIDHIPKCNKSVAVACTFQDYVVYPILHGNRLALERLWSLDLRKRRWVPITVDDNGFAYDDDDGVVQDFGIVLRKLFPWISSPKESESFSERLFKRITERRFASSYIMFNDATFDAKGVFSEFDINSPTFSTYFIQKNIRPIMVEYADKPMPKELRDLLINICGDEDAAKHYLLHIAMGFVLDSDIKNDCARALFTVDPLAGTGKSTFLKVLEKAVGDMVKVFDVSDAHNERKSCDYPMALWVIDHDGGGCSFIDMNSVNAIKKLVSGDKMWARELYKNPVEFYPKTQLIVMTNHNPVCKDKTYAWTRRIEIYRPKTRLTRSGEWFERLLSQDTADWLLAHLLTLAQQIINCGGSANRHKLFEVPKSMLEASEEYEKANNNTIEFTESELSDVNAMLLTEAYGLYVDWCKESGYATLKLGKFKEAVNSTAFEVRRIDLSESNFGDIYEKVAWEAQNKETAKMGNGIVPEPRKVYQRMLLVRKKG